MNFHHAEFRAAYASIQAQMPDLAPLCQVLVAPLTIMVLLLLACRSRGNS